MSMWGEYGMPAVKRVFRVIGKQKFVNQLKDFLLHGGRASRTETMREVTTIVKNLEEAQTLRTKRLAEIVEMMKAAGFSDEKIQEKIHQQSEIESVSQALDIILHYVENGDVQVKMVEDDKTHHGAVIEPPEKY